MADAPRPDPRTKAVVLRVPGMDEVRVRRDVPWRVSGSESLTLDVYAPHDSSRAPAVVFAAGYPDPGLRAVVGCRFKEMGQYVSWARLLAASGLAAICYENREPADLPALLEFVRERDESLGIDAARLAAFGCSGNGPIALSAALSGALRCAVFAYAYLLDLDGSSAVADAAKTFGFANACAGKSLADLPPSLPLFVARAGRDQLPGLNESLDRFAAAALSRNLPLTLVNHSEGPHGFDVSDEGETSRDVVRRIVAFLRLHLSA
jgi:hypothetical protein